MNWYIVLLTCLGLLILAAAWLPPLLCRLPLSLPIICVAFGFALFSIPDTGPEPDLLGHPRLTERLTELIVIVALMGAGLKLNRPVGWRPLFPHLIGALAPGGVLLYETFALGHAAYGKPARPGFLLGPGALLDLVRGRLQVVACEHGDVAEPRPSVRQRICATNSAEALELSPQP